MKNKSFQENLINKEGKNHDLKNQYINRNIDNTSNSINGIFLLNNKLLSSDQAKLRMPKISSHKINHPSVDQKLLNIKTNIEKESLLNNIKYGSIKREKFEGTGANEIDIPKLIRMNKKESDEQKNILSRNLKNTKNPVIINEIYKTNFTLFKNKKQVIEKLKIINIALLHREEFYCIQINNNFTIKRLIIEISNLIKLTDNQFELILVYQDSKKDILSKNNIGDLLYSQKKLKININQSKFIKNNLPLISIDKGTNQTIQKEILLLPDTKNRYFNMKIKDLLKDKYKFYFIANRILNKKFLTSLSENNINNKSPRNKKRIKQKIYEYEILVEKIKNFFQFFHYFKQFLIENKIMEKYKCENLEKDKYCIGFEKEEVMYAFIRFLVLLKIVNKHFYNIKYSIKADKLKKKQNNKNSKKLNNNVNYRNYFHKYCLSYEEKISLLKENLKGLYSTYDLNKI